MIAKHPDGYAFGAARRLKPTTPAAEAALIEKARAGDKAALDELLVRNLRFVNRVAMQYTGQGLPLPDLVSEGCIGMIRAAQRFNPALGHKFISYAVWWIRQAILEALAEQSRPISVRANQVGVQSTVGAIRASLEQRLGRAAHPDELADAVENKAPSWIRSAFRRQPFLAHPPEFLRLQHSADGEAPFDVADTNPGPDEPHRLRTMNQYIRSILQDLKQRDREMVRRRYGLHGQAAETLQEIAERMGLTRERVRQILDASLVKIRKRAAALALAERMLDVFGKRAGEKTGE